MHSFQVSYVNLMFLLRITCFCLKLPFFGFQKNIFPVRLKSEFSEYTFDLQLDVHMDNGYTSELPTHILQMPIPKDRNCDTHLG